MLACAATIAGTNGRRYTVAYELRGKKLVEELAFVLRGETEYLLLASSFRLG